MRYLETVKEKKYKPLFGYGYEPRTIQKKERGKKQKEPKYDMFGNMIYELPVEAEAETEEPRPFDQDPVRINGNDRADDADAEPAGVENGFEKPEGNPLMGVVIAMTLVIALFLMAVIMSLKNEPETVRKPAPCGSIISCMSNHGFQADWY